MFHPENETDARSYIAGLIPYLKDSVNNPWFLKQFLEEARLRHATSKWDPKTRQAYTAEEAELNNFLEEDDELNLMDELPINQPIRTREVEINIQKVSNLEDRPTMYNDTDSISMFHPVTPSQYSSAPSVRCSPKTIPTFPTSGEDNSDSISKMTNSESRFSSLEYKFNQFQEGIKDIRRQAKKDSQKNAKTLAEILALLHTGQPGGTYQVSTEHIVPSDRWANHPDQLSVASGSTRTTGSGS
jgi:hypothetical protein